MQQYDIIYKEGDQITESKKYTLLIIIFWIVYFIVEGSAGYVLPRYDNRVYLVLEQGDHFGHVDIGISPNYFRNQKSQMRKKSKLSFERRFTV
jgi:hypothetical protein